MKNGIGAAGLLLLAGLCGFWLAESRHRSDKAPEATTGESPRPVARKRGPLPPPPEPAPPRETTPPPEPKIEETSTAVSTQSEPPKVDPQEQRRLADEYKIANDAFREHLGVWSSTIGLASSTPRESLAPQLQKLSDLRHQLQSRGWPAPFLDAANAQLKLEDLSYNFLLDYLNGNNLDPESFKTDGAYYRRMRDDALRRAHKAYFGTYY